MRALLYPSRKFLTAAGVALLLAAAPAQAQDRDMAARLGKVEQDLVRLQRAMPGGRPNAAEAAAADAQASQEDTDITVRLSALEGTVAQLTGQVEETKFIAERTAKQVQVMQDDLSLRLARIEASLGASGVALPALPQQSAAPAATQSASNLPAAQTRGLPNTQQGGSPPLPTITPGAPLSAPVSTQPSSTPLAPPPAAAAPAQTATLVPAPSAVPSDNGVGASGGFVIRTDAQGRPLAADPSSVAAAAQVAAAQPAPPVMAPAPQAAPGPGPVTSNQLGAGAAPTNVSLPTGTPKEQYEFAFDFLKRQDYPKAEVTLREFLKKNPKDPLAGNAQYWLGETYYVRGDFQQAAVEFMAGYQNYPKTNKGPDNLLKLGMSMAKLNQTAGACTALGRLGKDYPNAEDAIEKQAKAERTRLKCK